MAMVLQDPMTSLNPLMRVGRQIVEGMVHHLGVSAREANTRAVERLIEVGIGMPRRRCRQYPHALSGGQRQRVAIAIALACRPRLLIADEPTTALDVTVQAGILDLLTRLQEKTGMAMILITHDLGVVSGRAHETAVMYAGKLVEIAPTRQLFMSPRMPYTGALLAATPRLSDPPHRVLDAIDGSLPDPLRPPIGCAFAPRCHRAAGRCKRASPPLRGDSCAGHRYACWYPLEPAEATP
jgi:oligopeptide/dipeptide ABC transporter ATP-binding protein